MSRKSCGTAESTPLLLCINPAAQTLQLACIHSSLTHHRGVGRAQGRYNLQCSGQCALAMEVVCILQPLTPPPASPRLVARHVASTTQCSCTSSSTWHTTGRLHLAAVKLHKAKCCTTPACSTTSPPPTHLCRPNCAAACLRHPWHARASACQSA